MEGTGQKATFWKFFLGKISLNPFDQPPFLLSLAPLAVGSLFTGRFSRNIFPGKNFQNVAFQDVDLPYASFR